MHFGERVIDAEFTVVSGPIRVGDPHPEHFGWLFSGLYDDSGEPLWLVRPWWITRHPFLTVTLAASAVAVLKVLHLLPGLG